MLPGQRVLVLNKSSRKRGKLENKSEQCPYVIVKQPNQTTSWICLYMWLNKRARMGRVGGLYPGRVELVCVPTAPTRVLCTSRKPHGVTLVPPCRWISRTTGTTGGRKQTTQRLKPQ